MSFPELMRIEVVLWAQDCSLLSSPAKSVEGCMVDSELYRHYNWYFTFYTVPCGLVLSFETKGVPLLMKFLRKYYLMMFFFLANRKEMRQRKG